MSNKNVLFHWHARRGRLARPGKGPVRGRDQTPPQQQCREGESAAGNRPLCGVPYWAPC